MAILIRPFGLWGYQIRYLRFIYIDENNTIVYISPVRSYLAMKSDGMFEY